MRARTGLSLVEILVAFGLLATAVMLILSLLPTGILTQKKAEDLQAAAMLGMRLVDEASEPTAFPVPTEELRVELNNTPFTATRDIKEVVGREQLYEVTVTLRWPGGGAPRVFKLRRLKGNR